MSAPAFIHNAHLYLTLLPRKGRTALPAHIAAWRSEFRHRNANLMRETLEEYVPADRKNDRRYIRRLRHELYFCAERYNVLYAEYFRYHFDLLSDAGRRQYVGDPERYRRCKLMSTRETQMIFENKLLTYQRFEKYYGREILHITGEADKAAFLAFLQKHPHCILKPLYKSLGHGVSAVNADTKDFDADACFAGLFTGEENAWLLEERIEQSECMAAFHPQSCNTMRVTSYLRDGKADILWCDLRMGVGGSVVDNAGAGGVLASVDPETGIVRTPAMTKKGDSFLCHPDTGAQIIGFHVPRWDELLALVDTLAHVVPEQPYVGWDLALTDNGWVMIEGNDRAQFGVQFAERRGYRDVIDAYFPPLP